MMHLCVHSLKASKPLDVFAATCPRGLAAPGAFVSPAHDTVKEGGGGEGRMGGRTTYTENDRCQIYVTLPRPSTSRLVRYIYIYSLKNKESDS